MAELKKKGKYQEWLEPDNLLRIKGWARDGLTDKEIAENKIGVRESTFCTWKSKYQQINETLKTGREPVDITLEDTFYSKKLSGYKVTETIKEKTVQRDASGNVIGTTEHVRESEKYIPPDTTAMIFYLKCRMKDKYNDRANISFNDVEDLTALAKLLNIGDSKNVENTDNTVETVQQETQ